MKSSDGSVHALGNGHLAAYGCGSDLIQLFGPPFGSPSFLSLTDDLDWQMTRQPKTAIYQHSRPDSVMTEWIDSALPVYIRHIKTQTPINLHLAHSPRSHISQTAPQQLTVWCEAGIPIYTLNPTRRPIYYQIALHNATADIREDGWHIQCPAGESIIYIAGGPEWPNAVANLSTAMALPIEESLQRTQKYWYLFSDQRPCVPSSLTEPVDATAILIRAQQSAEGGVLAGYNYHMGYVRDQYGVSRGLLAMGHTDAAQSIMTFYWNIWKQQGRIHNAHAMGVDETKHIHENDNTEITGYLLIQAFDILEATGDHDYIAKIQPMLEWAFSAQVGALIGEARDVLPFNGDETYVAGGILTRAALLHGSLEATMLFYTGGMRFLNWLQSRKAWPAWRIYEAREVLARIEKGFARHFLQNGIWCNDPDVVTDLSAPEFRHGICQGVMKFGWTRRGKDGYYYCPECFEALESGKREPQKPFRDRVSLASVSLMPAYIGSGLIPETMLSAEIEKMVKRYDETGRLPSRPDGTLALGYDYGLLLYNLTKRNHPAARHIFEQMLKIRDQAGAWVEYYDNHVPANTRCRPWESGINIEAAIMYAGKSDIS